MDLEFLLIPSPSPPRRSPQFRRSVYRRHPGHRSLHSRHLAATSTLRHADILPRTNNKGGVDSREGINGSDPNDVSSKRRRLSDPIGGGPALSGHSGPSSFCPVMETKYDESRCTSVDRNLASTARTSPVMFESASPTAPKLSPIHDANGEWEVRKIIGKEYVDGVLHYLVERCPTLEPQHSLGHAKELVDKFESQLRAHRGTKSRRGGVGLKIKKQMALESDAFDGHQQKKRRGRP